MCSFNLNLAVFILIIRLRCKNGSNKFKCKKICDNWSNEDKCLLTISFKKIHWMVNNGKHYYLHDKLKIVYNNSIIYYSIEINESIIIR